MACLAPNKLSDGTEVACRECKLCQLKAKNDWVGRNIAESKTSKFCYVITATYGRGKVGERLHERAVILTYSDCQKLLKLLRRHGYEVRFFITGEYGSEKQRAHWNIIVYSNEPLPAFSGWDQYGKWTKKARFKQRFNWVRTDAKGDPVKLQSGEPAYWWPHGFVHIDEVNVSSVRYVCKYVLKDLDANGKQGHKGQSKAPPLGAKYFAELAEKYVEQGLAPQTPEYRFPEARTREGEPIIYWLKGRSLEMFLQHYVEAWADKKGDQPRPPSQMVDLYEEYGRVVNDEIKMLVRQEFPRGESRAPIPTGPQMVVGGEQVRFERARDEYGRMLDELRQQDARAASGEEGQRQEEFNDELAKQWYAFHHKWARHFYKEHGWQLRAGRTEPCECCDLSDDPQRTEPGASPRRVGQQRPEYGLGKVGRWNRDYAGTASGPGESTGPGDGSTGPGDDSEN